MFKILEINNCPRRDNDGCIHIKVLFDNNIEKSFCTYKDTEELYKRKVELYYVITNLSKINPCICSECMCGEDVYSIGIADNLIHCSIYYCEEENTDDPYYYKCACHGVNYFKELYELIDFIREKHPKWLKPIKLAIHNE